VITVPYCTQFDIQTLTAVDFNLTRSKIVSECIFSGMRSNADCMVKLTNRQLNPTFQLIPDDSFQLKAQNSNDLNRGYFQISPTTGIVKMRNSPNGTFYYSVCLNVSPKIENTLSGSCGKLVIIGRFLYEKTQMALC